VRILAAKLLMLPVAAEWAWGEQRMLAVTMLGKDIVLIAAAPAGRTRAVFQAVVA
jgi:hypothetical protein